ncbi:hypothetical protein NL676_021386 [Syzygium grande]|nr:hypothetical protein NL676_021386 [Syzygium grande]
MHPRQSPKLAINDRLTSANAFELHQGLDQGSLKSILKKISLAKLSAITEVERWQAGRPGEGSEAAG